MLRNRRPVHVRVPRAIAVSTLALSLILAAAPGSAQSVDTRGTAEVSVPRANFRADCSMSAEVVATLTEGEEVEVLGTAGSWYRVRHDESGIEGCMHQTVLGRVTPSSAQESEELEEWEEERREREQEARNAEAEAERERREAELEAREDEADRRARGEKRVTGYLDLNIGYGTPGEDRLNSEGAFFLFTDPPTPLPNSHHEDEYRYGGDLTYGIAGGVLVALRRGGSVGGGASLLRSTYTVNLDLEGSLPHFRLPGIVVGDDIATKGPDRTETALHIHGVYSPPTPEELRVRIFAGPTVFRIELPIWERLFWEFPVNPPRVEFQRVEFDKREETVVGGHLGADVAYFFSKVFGIGGSALYSRGTEEFEFSPPESPEGKIVEEVTLGGFSAMLGVRFRF